MTFSFSPGLNWVRPSDMFPRKIWTLVVLPNFLLVMGHAFPPMDRKQFDEGYLASDQQLWIKYEGPGAFRFQGVWANSVNQKNITGVRQGNQWVFQSGNSVWKAQLTEESSKCEPVLQIQNINSPEKPIQLRANYCGSRSKKNIFF